MNILEDIPNYLTLIVGVIFIISAIGSIFYYTWFFRLTGHPKNKQISENLPLTPVSVIICARNEAENLMKNIPAVMEQDYPIFEVIIVDDCSEDNTQEIITILTNKYKNLKCTIIKKDVKFSHSKKLALTIGIKAAANEHLLLTDADCYPSSNQWIKQIASNYKEDIDIVLAYGAYITQKGFLNQLIRYETVFTAMQYMGFTERGYPFMGVGRNLSYRKSLFFKNKGFASHLGLISGDDDLFISETANSKNVAIETHPDSFTLSTPKKSFRDWFKQRKRHFTTGSRYKLKIKRLLLAEYSSRIAFFLSLLYLLINGHLTNYVLIIFFLTTLIKGIVYKIVLKRLNENFLFLFSLIIELFIPYIYLIVHFSNLIDKKRSKWN